MNMLHREGEKNDTQQIIFRIVTGCNFLIQLILLGWEQDRQNNSLPVKRYMGNRKKKIKKPRCDSDLVIVPLTCQK